MIIVLMAGLGLIFGSFINALVWRVRQQESGKKLSVIKGRSMCPNCGHQLSANDLVPVFSWVALGGKCRYCSKPISAHYPLVELATALLFVLSYLYFPIHLPSPIYHLLLTPWLAIVVGLIALFVYDLKWMILPDKIVFPLILLAAVFWAINFLYAPDRGNLLISTLLALGVSSGLFYLVLLFSGGRWIGGGDVKLGLIFGLVLADPLKSSLVLFAASVAGTLIVLPGVLMRRTSLQQKIPFGPLLIAGFIAAFFIGQEFVDRYTNALLFSH